MPCYSGEMKESEELIAQRKLEDKALRLRATLQNYKELEDYIINYLNPILKKMRSEVDSLTAAMCGVAQTISHPQLEEWLSKHTENPRCDLYKEKENK